MPWITFPSGLTEEEKMLQQKYQKLKRKKKQLADLNAPKVEPVTVEIPIKRKASDTMKTGLDAKEKAARLLKLGKIKPIEAPKVATEGFKRKRLNSDRPGGDRPGGYQPFSSSQGASGDNNPDDDLIPLHPSDPLDHVEPQSTGPSKYGNLYSNFVSAKDAEIIAREETIRERKRDGKGAHYINRDVPNQGNTLYIKGQGISENLLRTGLQPLGHILNIMVETEKNIAFVTFETIDEANRVIDTMNGKSIDGIHINVSMAKRQMHLKNNYSKPHDNQMTSGSGSSASNSWSAIAANYSKGSSGGNDRNRGNHHNQKSFNRRSDDYNHNNNRKAGLGSSSRSLPVYDADLIEPDDDN